MNERLSKFAMSVMDELRNQFNGDLSSLGKQEVPKVRPRHLRDITIPEVRFETRRKGNELGLIPGQEISWLTTARIFGKDFPKFRNYVLGSFSNDDQKKRWNKFCVSRTAESCFEQDDNLIYFELKDGEKKNPKVIFLGVGKSLGDAQVYCGYAAETLGYKFLGLGKRKWRRFDAKSI